MPFANMGKLAKLFLSVCSLKIYGKLLPCMKNEKSSNDNKIMEKKFSLHPTCTSYCHRNSAPENAIEYFNKRKKEKFALLPHRRI